MTSKGKRLTYLTIALGVFVLLVAGYAAKDRAVEQWYLWKLESDDEQGSKHAAERLGEMGSVRAMPVILRILQRADSDLFIIVFPPEPYVDTSRAFVVDAKFISLEPSGIWAPINIDRVPDRPLAETWLVPGDSFFLLDALWKLTSVAGKRSVPYLVTALNDSGWYVPYLSALLLGRMGPNARGAIPALTTALRHESESVRNAAAEALKKIQGEHPVHEQR